MTNSESEGCVLEHGEEDAIPYTQILNEFINHEQISWFSKMILIYLLARPPGWKTNTNHLASIYKGELRGNGKKAILSALKELRDFGYIVYENRRLPDGRFSPRYFYYRQPRKEIKIISPQRLERNAVEGVGIINKEYKKVVVKENPSLREVEQPLPFTKDDLYSYVVRLKKDWTTQEIEDAWKIYSKNKKPISDPQKYIEGIIKNFRAVKHQKGEKKCKTTNQLENTPKKKSSSANEFYSEKDTSDTPLARFARLNGLK